MHLKHQTRHGINPGGVRSRQVRLEPFYVNLHYQQAGVFLPSDLAAIAALSEQITGMRRDLGNWVERVGYKLTAIQDDIRVNYTVSLMQRQIPRLQTQVNDLLDRQTKDCQ